MTPEQLATLKAFALADPTAAGYMTAGNDTGLSQWLNEPTSFQVYRTSVPRVEIQNEAGTGGAGGSASEWDWTVYKNQSVSEQGAWRDMAMGDGINFAKEKVRAGIAKIFTGSAAANAMRDHILSFGRRNANRVEQALAVGTGTAQSPATMTFEGSIDTNIAAQIRTA